MHIDSRGQKVFICNSKFKNCKVPHANMFNFKDCIWQDLTVKGLEPEIQRLISQHKSELKKLKTIHEAELLQSDERAGQRYVSMTEELRDQLAREKETACHRERELAAQR